MKLYLSGPITGDTGHYQRFKTAEEQLELLGYDVVNPLEIDHGGAQNHSDFMRGDIAALCGCDGLALLPLVVHSKGAIAEMIAADAMGIPVKSVSAWAREEEGI